MKKKQIITVLFAVLLVLSMVMFNACPNSVGDDIPLDGGNDGKETGDDDNPLTGSQFSVTVIGINSAEGTVTVSDSSAETGMVITITVTPQSGYKYRSGSLSVAASGAPVTSLAQVGATLQWTFTMPGANVTVSCGFDLDGGGGGPYNIDFSGITNGSVLGPPLAMPGAVITIYVNPDSAYQYSEGSLTVTRNSNGSTVTLERNLSLLEWKFTMPPSDITVSCTFILDTGVRYLYLNGQFGQDLGPNRGLLLSAPVGGNEPLQVWSNSSDGKGIDFDSTQPGYNGSVMSIEFDWSKITTQNWVAAAMFFADGVTSGNYDLKFHIKGFGQMTARVGTAIPGQSGITYPNQQTFPSTAYSNSTWTELTVPLTGAYQTTHFCFVSETQYGYFLIDNIRVVPKSTP